MRLSHPYLRFRVRLARHGLARFAASVTGSAQIVLPLFGPAIVGLVALAALPTMYAATLPLPTSMALTGAHALLAATPLWLLRKRLLPQDVAAWLHPLPVSRGTRVAADALVAGLVAVPLAAIYGVSLAIWLVQRPQWIDPVPGVLATVLSLLLSWAGGIALLALRARVPRPGGRARGTHAGAPAARYAAQAPRWRRLFLWRMLYWLPLWRGERGAGWQLALLLAGAAGGALLWMLAPAGMPRGAWALCASAALVLLAERADAARRAQRTRLDAVLAPWPLAPRALELPARAFALAPGLAVLALLALAGAAAGAWDGRAGRLYLALAGAAQLLFVAVPSFTARARVGTVGACILVLTAVGSEIWN